jgi:L-lactate dehydrogenase complex protein LldG
LQPEKKGTLKRLPAPKDGPNPGISLDLSDIRSANNGKNANKDNGMSTREIILQKLKAASNPETVTGLPDPFIFNRHLPCADLFKTMAAQNGILVHEAQNREQIPAMAMRQYPELFRLQKVCVSPCLSGLPWHATHGRFIFKANDGTTLTGISCADAAVAQTGALVFFNRGDNPAVNHFLPEHHIIVLKASQINETMSEVLAASSCKTNAVNLIAGPSSTADIAGQMLVGVHGPARVICYIIKN